MGWDGCLCSIQSCTRLLAYLFTYLLFWGTFVVHLFFFLMPRYIYLELDDYGQRAYGYYNLGTVSRYVSTGTEVGL